MIILYMCFSYRFRDGANHLWLSQHGNDNDNACKVVTNITAQLIEK